MNQLGDLTITVEQVEFIIEKAKQFFAKDVLTDPDDSSNGSDDGMSEILEDHADDPVRHELVSFIRSMNEDEQIDLVALMWLGRGDDQKSAFAEIRAEAALEHTGRTASYLLGTPLLPDYLEEALSLFDDDERESDLPSATDQPI